MELECNADNLLRMLFTKEKYVEVCQNWFKYDKDRSHFLTRNEATNVLKDLMEKEVKDLGICFPAVPSPSNKEVDGEFLKQKISANMTLFSAFIDYCDVDGDGSISFFEFIIMTIRKELEQQGVKMSRSDVVKHTCSFMQSDHTNPKVLVEFFFRLIKTLFLRFFIQEKVMNDDIKVKIQEVDETLTVEEAFGKRSLKFL